jgi:hypothetical protein
MRLNLQGATIYEVGDTVILTDTRPSNWESGGAMDHYLNNVVTITGVAYDSSSEHLNNPNGRFAFSGSSSWSFQIADIATIANPEIIEEYRQRRERQLAELKERFKTFVFTADEVYAIAKDIFGEEYIDIENISPTEFNIIVLFPEINITNSRRHKHVIKDLYVKINVDISVQNVDSGDRLSTIKIEGRRGKLSEEEFQSNYGHSHFSGSGTERWSDFCLGSSDFAMIIQTMRFSLAPEDWMLFFLSLENYVSWESLEGGPYRNIQNIALRQQTHNTSDFINHALELIKTLPNACLTLNGGKIEMNTDHPALLDHYTSRSRIKSFRSDRTTSFESMQTRFNDHVNRDCRPFAFKGKIISPVLYRKSAQGNAPEQENMDQDVIDFYNRTIIKELKKYNVSYDYNKIAASSTLLREASPF